MFQHEMTHENQNPQINWEHEKGCSTTNESTEEHVDFPKFRATGTDRQKGSRAKTVRECKSKPLCFTATAHKSLMASHIICGRWHSPSVLLLIHQVLFTFTAQRWMKDNENLNIFQVTPIRDFLHPNGEMWSYTQLLSLKVPASYSKIKTQNKQKSINLKILYFWKYQSSWSDRLISSLLFLYSFSQFPSGLFFFSILKCLKIHPRHAG